LMVQANPGLTPNQVKYRLTKSAKPAFSKFSNGQPVFNTLQQGLGRVWAPDAVLGTFDAAGSANLGIMDINADLAHGYIDYSDLASHYQGPVRRILSADGTAYLYYATTTDGTTYGLGATDLNGNWLSSNAVTNLTWGGMQMTWSGGLSSTAATPSASMQMTWSGSTSPYWASMQMTWSGSRLIWNTMQMTWSGGLGWAGGSAWSSMQMTWSGSLNTYTSSTNAWTQSIANASGSSSGSLWVDDNWIQPTGSSVPLPSGVFTP